MPNFEVTIDDIEYHIASLYDCPLVCDLQPGRHMLRMLRSGQVLYEEAFTLSCDEEVVLIAWYQRDEIPSAQSLTHVVDEMSKEWIR
jgi:hypothetical protein